MAEALGKRPAQSRGHSRWLAPSVWDANPCIAYLGKTMDGSWKVRSTRTMPKSRGLSATRPFGRSALELDECLAGYQPTTWLDE